MQPLRALLLSDGRPGHYHLAEGVLAAIARRRPVETARLEVARRGWLPGRAVAALVRLGVPARHVLGIGYGIDAGALPPADLVVSAGGETLAANVGAARALGAPNIFCGTLRHLGPEHVRLVISSYQRHARLARHLVTLKPNPVDPDSLDQGLRSPASGNGSPRLAGLLVGGDSGLFHYGVVDWQRLIAFIEGSHAQLGTRWIVSTSRRTDPATADILVHLANRTGGPIDELIDFRSAGPGTLPRLLTRAEAILATEDSSSMISEAISARLPVVGVSPERHAFSDDEREYRALMTANRWCQFMPLAELGPETFVAALGQITPLAGNHLDLLAGQLLERLPELGMAS